MIKFLLIIGLVAYGLYKFGSLFFKAGAASQQHFREPRKPNTINVDAEPTKKGKTFKGGEYVDYEEVK